MSNDLWIIAPSGVSFRSQPNTAASVLMGIAFGQHVSALNAESAIDASGRSWLQVQTDAGSIGFIAATLDGERLISNTKPADPFQAQVVDNQIVRDAGGLAVRDHRNVMLAAIDVAQPGEKLTVFGRVIESDGTPWLWVSSPRNQFGWVREKVSGVILVSKPGDTPTPPTSSTEVWVISDIGLILRDQPAGSFITGLIKGTHLITIGAESAVDASGRTWQQVRTDDNQTGWVAASVDGDPTFNTINPAATSTPVVTTNVVPWGKCLIGLGMADQRRFDSTDLGVIRKSQIEAFKIITLGDPDDTRSLISDLRSIRSDMFIVARLFFSTSAGNKFTPQEFIDFCQKGLDACYQAGVEYFEVHNEPNLPDEGFGGNWATGADFDTWLTQVLGKLRGSLKYPKAKWGYPGLSPQFGGAFDTDSFLNGSANALALCDWIGVHCYWQTINGPAFPMTGPRDGMFWNHYRDRFPNKLLMVTEFSNNRTQVNGVPTTDSDKATQYAQYYRSLRHENNLGAAFSFALSWENQDKNGEGWIFRNNGKVNETKIGSTLGSSVAAQGLG